MAERLAVVTGATGTLGREVVRLLAARGLAVVAVSRSGAPCDAGEACSIAADVGEDGSIDHMRAALPPGDLAIAVHSVGLPPAPHVMEVDPVLLGAAVNIKAGGLLRLLRAVDSRIGEGSRVVAVGGHLGFEPTEHAPLAGVANAALANLVRQLEAPLHRRGASVHLVAPAYFDSPRTERMIAAKASATGHSIEQVRAEMAASAPGGHLPSAKDVALSIVALLEAAPGATVVR